MKRTLSLLLAAVMLLGLCACGKKEAEAKLPEIPYPLDKYNLDAYMIPYWNGDIVYQEAVMLLENKDGTLPDIPLLYKAKQIVSVRSSDLKTEYQAGKDYTLVDGKLHIPAGSTIPTVKYDFYYPAEKTDKSIELNEKYGSGYLFFSEGSVMHSMQIAVTYTHEGSFSGQIPTCKADQLPKLKAKLQNGEDIKLCVFGDSISTGANSSMKVNALPMARPWFQMIVDTMKQKYPESKVSLYNPSVGGKTSEWGVGEADMKLTYGPDVCIIGFGMNDGTLGVPAQTFQDNIKAIMETVRSGNPDCEFVLLASMMPNPEAGNFLGNQAEYLPMLKALETEGVVVADMTTYHQYLLTLKRFYDMSGNNINHPNDFLARAYAHVLWQTMFGY